MVGAWNIASTACTTLTESAFFFNVSQLEMLQCMAYVITAWHSQYKKAWTFSFLFQLRANVWYSNVRHLLNTTYSGDVRPRRYMHNVLFYSPFQTVWVLQASQALTAYRHFYTVRCNNCMCLLLWAGFSRTRCPLTWHHEEHLSPLLGGGCCQQLLQALWVQSSGINVMCSGPMDGVHFCSTSHVLWVP